MIKRIHPQETILDIHRSIKIIQTSPRGKSKVLKDPATTNLSKILRKEYPEISKQNPRKADFLMALLKYLKQTLPKANNHQEFAQKVINKLSKNPTTKAELKRISDIKNISIEV